MRQTVKNPDYAILIFSKAPVVGKVNTRLVPYITAEQAAALHEELAHDRLSMCTAANICDVQLWCSPDADHRFFTDCMERYGVHLYVQQGSNLGERIIHAFRTLREQYRKIIIIGTDAPALDINIIGEVFDELDHKDIALVPAEDGGYVLIGASNYHDKLLYGVPWGTENVLASTVRNCEQLGLEYGLVGECWDVDRPEDLERYRQLKV